VQIKISARHGNLSEETQSKITAKLEKLGRVFDRLGSIEMIVDLERRDEPLIDGKVSTDHKHDFVATYRSADLLGSVDQVIHKLEQQLRKYKEKIVDHHRAAGSRPSESEDAGTVED
jgi:putative sigma-54 modulation protein